MHRLRFKRNPNCPFAFRCLKWVPSLFIFQLNREPSTCTYKLCDKMIIFYLLNVLPCSHALYMKLGPPNCQLFKHWYIQRQKFSVLGPIEYCLRLGTLCTYINFCLLSIASDDFHLKLIASSFNCTLCIIIVNIIFKLHIEIAF